MENRMLLNVAFKKVISGLNTAQHEAVNTIDGPVLVVAGPGTGKTQLLAARIGNILLNSDTKPGEILCLTYTDAGSIAMRQRLLKFIGPEAYKVQIFTYHAFCNTVIQENIEYFGGFRNLDKVSELDQADILQEIIDALDQDNILRRLKGDMYYEEKRMKDLFGIMKKENWSPSFIKSHIDEYRKDIYDNPDFLYKRKYTDKKSGKVYEKGDANVNKINKELDKYDVLEAAIFQFDEYNKKLLARERFDYDDMIRWVISAFKKQELLLAKYQERFQYFLVDEYQDTNGSQNALIFSLASYWDNPNLFVVGDDDQSIYRFQGANMANIVDFKERFKPKVIVLDYNYRSSQEILDVSKNLIEYNQERLVYQYPEYTKNLLEKKTVGLIKADPNIYKFHNPFHEESFIANEIIRLYKEGVDLSSVAVIYPKHANAERIVRYLSLEQIPLNLKRRLDVLKLAEARKIINILRYMFAEYQDMHKGEHYLFEILHYVNFGIKAKDIAKLSAYCGRRSGESNTRPRWRDSYDNLQLLKSIGISEPEKIVQTAELIEHWIQQIPNVTLQVLIETIYTESNILHEALKGNDTAWQLQILNTLLDFVKEESVKTPEIDLKEFLRMVDKMLYSNVQIPIQKITHNAEGVHFLTGHSSKGLEFEYVFILNATQQNWIKSRRNTNQYSIPPNITLASRESDVEDDRRLFYVAMTRAKSHLNISFATRNDKDKDVEAASFISELLGNGMNKIQQMEVPEDQVLTYIAGSMLKKEIEPSLLDHELIDQVLSHYSMSVTALNKYLACPVRFYFENILRVPSARYPSTGFGNAMHYALEQFFLHIESREQKQIGSQEELLQHFNRGMDKYRSHFTEMEFANYKTHGAQTLASYYDRYQEQWDPGLQYKVEHQIQLTEHKGVPINGKIDKLIILPKNEVEVVDYKTGKIDASRTKPPLGEEDNGGDYWRQIVFYRMLIDADPLHQYKMKAGTMDYLEPNKSTGEFTKKVLQVSDMELGLVEDQLVDSYQKNSSACIYRRMPRGTLQMVQFH